MPTTSAALIQRILADPSCSHWLHDALESILTHDPVDAINDVEVLLKVVKMRWEEIKVEMQDDIAAAVDTLEAELMELPSPQDTHCKP